MSDSVVTASKIHVLMKSPGALAFNINTRQVPSCIQLCATCETMHIYACNLIRRCVITCILYMCGCIGCVCVCVCGLWHKSLEPSRGLVLLPPSVSVCWGEVFCTDDRANGGEARKSEPCLSRVGWTEKNKRLWYRRAAHVHHMNMRRDFGGAGGGGCLRFMINRISAGPVTHNLRAARVKQTLLSSAEQWCRLYNVSACRPPSPADGRLDTCEWIRPVTRYLSGVASASCLQYGRIRPVLWLHLLFLPQASWVFNPGTCLSLWGSNWLSTGYLPSINPAHLLLTG